MQEAFLLKSIHQIIEINPVDGREQAAILSELADRVLHESIAASEIAISRIENIVWAGPMPNSFADFSAIEVKREGLSGMQALVSACQSIRSGDLHVVAAGGSSVEYPVKPHTPEFIRQLKPGIEREGQSTTINRNEIPVTFTAACMLVVSIQAVGSANLSPLGRISVISQSKLVGPSFLDDAGRLVMKALTTVGVPAAEIDLCLVDASYTDVLLPCLCSAGIDPAVINVQIPVDWFTRSGEISGLLNLSCVLNVPRWHWCLLLQLGRNLDCLAVIIERV